MKERKRDCCRRQGRDNEQSVTEEVEERNVLVKRQKISKRFDILYKI